MEYTKDELQKKAENLFTTLKCEKLFATSDGNFFEEKNKQFAIGHSHNGHKLFELEKLTIETPEEKPKEQNFKKRK